MLTRLFYHKLDPTKQYSEIAYLLKYKINNYFLLGIEVTNNEIADNLHLNIDPQHSQLKSQMTSIEYCFNNQKEILEQLKKYEKIIISTIRCDADSIGSIAIVTMLLQNQFTLDGDLILRLKAIAKSDRHGRNWKNKREDFFQFENHNIYGLPIGLLYMCSDFRLSLKSKVYRMIKYLKEGTFSDINKYSKIASNRSFDSNIDIRIIIPNRLILVKSNHSGAVSIGYRTCPVVIAINDNYIFDNDRLISGKKITIAQYANSKFIDMGGLEIELNKLEPGFGGSSAIIGSRQDSPSELEDDQIIDLVRKYLK